MDRKNFMKKSLLGALGLTTAGSMVKGKTNSQTESTYDKFMKQVGFNHLPNKEIRNIKVIPPAINP